MFKAIYFILEWLVATCTNLESIYNDITLHSLTVWLRLESSRRFLFLKRHFDNTLML